MLRYLILLLFINLALASLNEEDNEHYMYTVVEKYVKLNLKLEKWKSGFEEKISLLEIELQNEKDANVELKKKLDDHIETNGITFSELSSSMDANFNSCREEVATMLNEKSREMEAKIETLSSRMAIEDKALRNDFNKLLTEKVKEMEIIMDYKDKSLKETFEEMFSEKLGEIEEVIGKIKWKMQSLDTGVANFQNCVNDWCYQNGTSQQFTKCESASSDGKTCYNPEIRYGSTVGGHPVKHSNNNILQWCQQLFPTSIYGDATFSNSSSSNVGKGVIFWSTSYDEDGYKWADWRDGYWKDSTIDESFSNSCSKKNHWSCIMTSVTCQ